MLYCDLNLFNLISKSSIIFIHKIVATLASRSNSVYEKLCLNMIKHFYINFQLMLEYDLN